MVSLEEAVIARLKEGENRFEILIDPKAAADFIDGKEVDILNSLAIMRFSKMLRKESMHLRNYLRKNLEPRTL